MDLEYPFLIFTLKSPVNVSVCSPAVFRALWVPAALGSRGGIPAPQRANLEQTLGEDLEMEQAGFRTSLGFDSCPLVGVVLPLILPDVPVHR